MVVLVLEKTYAKITTWQMMKNGKTYATDSGEVHAMNWIFKRKTYDGQKRKKLVWWTILLTTLLVGLLPAELVFETGIYERNNCAPMSQMSSGICASPWEGHGGDIVISSISLLTARAKWVDPEWETLLEGSQKSPVLNEVRKASALKPGRRAVLTACNVTVGRCSTSEECGNLTIWKSTGPYNTVVTSSSLLNTEKKLYALGDVTYDGSTRMAFLFWEGQRQHTEQKGKRLSLSVKGVEIVLSETESNRVDRGQSTPWNLIMTPSRTRLYSIHCSSDGMTEKDLTHGLSIYRTMQMEQPGVQRTDVDHDIDRVLPISSSDVLRSAYALKSEDWSKTCRGEIDVYVPCGDFNPTRSLPFIITTFIVAAGWIAIRTFLPEGDHPVPCGVTDWRALAHKQARVLKYFLQSATQKTTGNNIVFSEFNGPQHVLCYSRKKYEFYHSEQEDAFQKSLPHTVHDVKAGSDDSDAGPKISN